MKGFLEETARDLYERLGAELSHCVVLLPSRRAHLFLTDALIHIVREPMWQPRWATIDGLMSEISGLQVADRIRLITELYKVYSKHHQESFDKFYFWGDMLLTDFDTIDKYLIDADMLFSNISDLKELEGDLSYLTPEQLKILSFWASFGEEKNYSLEQRKFMKIWRTLAPIYHEFRERLSSLGLAYKGMVHRRAVEMIKSDTAEWNDSNHYVIAGFNALSECEKCLFHFIEKNTETDFYWDYDTYYKDNKEQEAGMFIRQNVAEFPMHTSFGRDYMSQPKQLRAVAAVSNAVQCKYAARILQQLAQTAPLDKQTAVVLTDESLLMPLLYAIPKELGEVNVTMGYPLRTTMAYTFVERLIELQHHRRKKGDQVTFYHVDVMGLLAHPFFQAQYGEEVAELQKKIVEQRRISVAKEWLATNDLFAAVFSATDSWQDLSDYLLRVIDLVARIPNEDADLRERNEFLAVLSEEISKLRNSLNTCDIELSVSIYVSLLRRHLQTVRIPFKGEPLKGIQVMGILETRNLDFKNVIILSMDDDNFPGNRMGDSSFIPYNLRSGYGLPTTEHHEGVYAYYFYRLIQRAERVYMIYCSHADEKTTGEPSRYIRQLDYESGFKIHKTEVEVDVNLVEVPRIEVEKTEEVMHSLMRFVAEEQAAMLSPSAFSRYVACPLSFYFASVARLRTDDEISEEVDAPMLGTILHDAAETIYKQVKKELHPRQTLDALLRSGAVEKAVEESINKNFLCDKTATKDDYTGNLLLVEDIVIRYLKHGVMEYDIRHNDFTTIGTEQKIGYRFPFECAGKQYAIHLGGIADRIDRLDDDSLRVVDYKTGSSQLDFGGVDKLFGEQIKDRKNNVLQTLIYSMILYRTHHVETIPTLYYVRQMNRADYSPLLVDHALGVTGAPYSIYASTFEELLREKLGELFDPAIPFRQCDDSKNCDYCDFKAICKRT